MLRILMAYVSCPLVPPTTRAHPRLSVAPAAYARRRTFEHTLQERSAVLICPGGQAEMCLTNRLHRHKEFSVYSRHKGAQSRGVGILWADGCVVASAGLKWRLTSWHSLLAAHTNLRCLKPHRTTPTLVRAQDLSAWH